MHGVTTAIVLFIFAGVIWPHHIKNKVQFYAALIIVAFIIGLDGAAHAFEATAKPIYAVNSLLQITAIVTLVLSAGMTVKDLGGEVLNTIDVVRRGGEKETIIVPLRGEQPKTKDRDFSTARADLTRDIAAEEAALDANESVPPPEKKPDTNRGSIPLD